MDLIDSAKVLVPALIKLPVTVWSGDQQVLKDLEDDFCFLPDRQPLYTAKGLRSFFEKKEGQNIYLLKDALDTMAVIARCEERWIILGPFVCHAWQETAAKVLLSKCGVQGSGFLPYKLYRCKLPILQQGYVVHIMSLLLGDAAPSKTYGLETIDMQAQLTATMDVRIAQKHEKSEMIDQRYAVETQLIEAASQGDIARTLQLFEKFGDDSAIYHFEVDRVSDWIASAAITRTWIRLAAVKAGLPPVIIDAVSQEYAQRMMHGAIDKEQLLDLQRRFIIDLCTCIRRYRKTSYSPYVKRAIEYIDTHISQDITIHTLCEINHVTQKHFAKLFSQETGKTVKQYLMQVRCERAAELLQNSQLLIQEISHYVGYEDNNYFSKIFRTVMGVSPQEYRRDKTFYTV